MRSRVRVFVTNLPELALGAEALALVFAQEGKGGRRRLEDCARVAVRAIDHPKQIYVVEVVKASRVGLGYRFQAKRSELYDVGSRLEKGQFRALVDRYWGPRWRGENRGLKG